MSESYICRRLSADRATVQCPVRRSALSPEPQPNNVTSTTRIFSHFSWSHFTGSLSLSLWLTHFTITLRLLVFSLVQVQLSCTSWPAVCAAFFLPSPVCFCLRSPQSVSVLPVHFYANQDNYFGASLLLGSDLLFSPLIFVYCRCLFIYKQHRW